MPRDLAQLLFPGPHAERSKAATAVLAILGIAVAVVVGQFVFPGGLQTGVIAQGLVLGGLSSFTAMGIVLIYRSGRFINISQAALGAVASSIAVVAVIGWGFKYWFAVLIGLIAAGILGFVVERLVVERLRNAPRLILTVATLGIFEILAAVNLVIPHLAKNLGQVTDFTSPFHSDFHINPLIFDGNDLLALCVLPVVLLALWWFLEKTEYGIAIRASADGAERAQLLGIPVRSVGRVVWVVAAILSGIGAILTTPITEAQSFGSTPTTDILLPALAAAVLARFESFPSAVAWSLAIGVLQQSVFYSYGNSAYTDVALFILVVIGLLISRRRPSRADGPGLGDYVAAREVHPVPKMLAKLPEVRIGRAAIAVLLLAIAISAPLALSSSQMQPMTYIPIYGVVAVSLVILTGWAGQISLGQFAFVGIGGMVTGVMLVHAGLDLFESLIVAAGVGAVLACVIGIPALRLPGMTLAAVTLAFAQPVSTWLLSSAYFPFLNPPQVNRPVLFDRFPLSLTSPTAFYELCLAVFLIILLIARNFRRSRVGRTVVAVRDNARGAAVFGISPLRSRLVAFALSGAMAGVAGGLYVLGLGGFSTGGITPDESITVFAMVVIGGLGSLSGALLGAVFVELVLYFAHGILQPLWLGVALLALLLFLPEGLGGVVVRTRDIILRRVAARRDIESSNLGTAHFVKDEAAKQAEREQNQELPGAEDQPGSAEKVGPGASGETEPKTGGETADELDVAVFTPVGGTGLAKAVPILQVEGADVEIGGNRVLFGLDFSISQGEIVALLGTNGAGKTTSLRTIAGVLRPLSGRVLIDGNDISGLTAEQRVAAGIVTVPGGRGIFPSLTVNENLKMAGWVSRRRGDREGLAAAEVRISQLFPRLEQRKDIKAGLLSGGEQQMLTIAQGLLCSPRILLIDELSLGLAPSVVAELLQAVRRLVDEGVTVVVVEQSVNVASAIAERAIFIDRGRVLFNGPMGDLAGRPDLLRSVFLGSGGQPTAVGGPKEQVQRTAGFGTIEPVKAEEDSGQADAPISVVAPAQPLRAFDAPKAIVIGGLPGTSPEDWIKPRIIRAEASYAPAEIPRQNGDNPHVDGEESQDDRANPAASPTVEVGGPVQESVQVPASLPAVYSPDSAFAVTGISKQFGGVSALSDVSFEVARGEILGIIGANGAGKTTLFDVCSGFLTSDGGRVLLSGHDVTNDSAASRANKGLGRVFQDARLFPSMTVSDVVATAFEKQVPVRDPFLALWNTAAVHDSESQVQEWVRELLIRFNLTSYGDKFITELSTGTRRIVELACVSAQRPSVLLLDEPTSGLAQSEAEGVGPRILDIRESTGAALVVIEHDVPLVSSVADRMICLHLGEVVSTGTPDEVLADPVVMACYLGEDPSAIARSGVSVSSLLAPST